MYRISLLNPVRSRTIVAFSLLVIAGCLPSPHKPLGGNSEKTKPPATDGGATQVDRPIVNIDVPVFSPTDSGGHPENDRPSEVGLDSRLALPAGPSLKGGFDDGPEADVSTLPAGLPPISSLSKDSPDSNAQPLSLSPLDATSPSLSARPTPLTSEMPLNPLPPILGGGPALKEDATDEGPKPTKLDLIPALSDKPTDPVAPPAAAVNAIPETPSLDHPLAPLDGDQTESISAFAEEVTPPDSDSPIQLGGGPVNGQMNGPKSLESVLTSPASDVTSDSPTLPLVNVADGIAPTVPVSPVNRLRAESIPLIPREHFFAKPKRNRARISPDGRLIAFLAERDGIQNVFVAPVEDLNSAKPVTNNRKEGVKNFIWAFTGQHVLFLQDVEDATTSEPATHVFVVNLATGERKDLTPLGNVSAYIASASHKLPAEIMVAIDERQSQLHDLYRVNIVTGERKLAVQNPGHEGYAIDDDYRVRIAYGRNAAGWRVYSIRSGPDQPWKDLLTVNPEDALGTGIVGFDKTGDQLYFIDSRERDLSVLKVIDLVGGREKRIAENPHADVSRTLIHPTEKNVQAVTFIHDRQKWQVIDSRINADLEYLHSVEDGELEITSRTLDDTLWTVVFRNDDAPEKYYLYRREPRSTKLLFNSRPELLDAPLAKMHAFSVPTRDGKQMVSFLSLPPGSDGVQAGRPAQPLPMVLLVHGGPWARDVWGYNALHQLLANRGYAVLSVNYRGSVGFGKDFANAGNREWASKMHDDLLDAVKWSVESRVALEDRIAIMGGGYGGYASLVGMTFTPDVFACGIDIVGPSNLVTLMENPPSYWAGMRPLVKDRVGDHESQSGREFLMSRSPVRFGDRIRRPLLIAQGADDPHATTADADQIVQAMRGNGVPVTFMVYPDEGHGFERSENRLAFYAVAEAFLAEHLGGRAEPIGSTLSRSSVEMPAGRDQIREIGRLGAGSGASLQQ